MPYFCKNCQGHDREQQADCWTFQPFAFGLHQTYRKSSKLKANANNWETLMIYTIALQIQLSIKTVADTNIRNHCCAEREAVNTWVCKTCKIIHIILRVSSPPPLNVIANKYCLIRVIGQLEGISLDTNSNRETTFFSVLCSVRLLLLLFVMPSGMCKQIYRGGYWQLIRLAVFSKRAMFCA